MRVLARLIFSASRAYTTRFPDGRGVWRLKRLVEHRALPALPRDMRVEVVTSDGRRFEENIHEPWFFNLMMLGRRDPAETRILENLVRPGDTVFDIGANYGWYATLLARLVGPAGWVHAFEPAPTTMKLLQKNCDANGVSGRIIFNGVGLSNAPGEAVIHVPHQHGGASLKPSYDKPTTPYTIPLTTLDEYIAGHAVGDIKIIKLDVEGSELPILQGATQLLSSPRPPMWLTEVSRATTRPFGYAPEDVMQHLGRYGYSICHVLNKPLGRLQPLPDVSMYHEGENVLCYPSWARPLVERFFV